MIIFGQIFEVGKKNVSESLSCATFEAGGGSCKAFCPPPPASKPLGAAPGWGGGEFKQLTVLYGHTKSLYRCSDVFDARCSMPPTSWEELEMDF